MNDHEIFERLVRIDPLPDGVPVEPAHSAQALTLMETIMTTNSLPPTTADEATGRTSADRPGVGRSRRMWLAGLGLTAVAAVAAVVVLPGPGGTRSTLAWSPVPQTTTAADADAARQTCSSAIDAAVAEAEAARAGASVPVAAAPTELAPLPPLTALDLRGRSGLAVFSDDTTMGVCMLLGSDSGFEFGGSSVFDLPADQPAGFAVSSYMATALGTDRAVQLVIGQAGAADRVEVVVPGLDTITATLSNGQYAAWWPSTEVVPVTVRSIAADGTILAEQALDPSATRTAEPAQQGGDDTAPTRPAIEPAP